MQKFYGTGVALITPFTEDRSVDTEALERIVTFNIENNIDYLVVLGTTAEAATLSKEEKELVKRTIIKINDNRLPLVLGVGGNNTAEVTEQLKTEDLSGFDAILSVSPYYNKPTQEGIYQHYKEVAVHSPLPVILYNVPGRTASNMLPSTVIRLAHDFENIIGIKEASGDLVQAMELVRKKPKNFLIISGDDMMALPVVLAGGAGVISVIGEAFPLAFSTLIKKALERKADEAYDIQYQLFDSINMIFEQGNPAGVKEVFKALGLTENYVRLPLVEVEEHLSRRIHSFVENFKF